MSCSVFSNMQMKAHDKKIMLKEEIKSWLLHIQRFYLQSNFREKFQNRITKDISILRYISHITFAWIPDHKIILGNEAADLMQKERAFFFLHQIHLYPLPPKDLTKYLLRLRFEEYGLIFGCNYLPSNLSNAEI